MPPKNATKKAVKKKPKNTGTPYELLTRDVFAKMEDLEKLGAKVQHDVDVPGKSGAIHQIDVLIEYELGGTKFRTIVQCKDWGSRVKKSHVMEFHDVLNDIPGQPRGIFVAKSGFQEGAKTVAKHHGIELYELREKKDEDWDGLYHTVSMYMTLTAPRFENVRVDPDLEWGRQQLVNMGVKGTFPLIPKVGDKMCTLESGKVVTWNSIFEPYMPTTEGVTKKVSLQFHRDRPTVELLGGPISRIPCIMLHADLSISVLEESFEITLDHFVAYCFKDVIAQKRRFLAADGAMPRAEPRRVDRLPRAGE